MSLLSYFYVFMQSNLLEVPFYVLAYREAKGSLPNYQKRNILDIALLITLSNMITHPIVFFVIMTMKIPFLWGILFAEGFAIVGETLLHSYFFKMHLRDTFIAALIANLVSWQLGPMITFWLFY